MAVPKRKTSKSKRDMRMSCKALKPINLAVDKAGDFHLQHCASYNATTGEYTYKGRVVLSTKKVKENSEN